MLCNRRSLLGIATTIGGREFQEDYFFTEYCAEGMLLAVMDGHNGPSTAMFVRNNFPRYFSSWWKRYHDSERAFRYAFRMVEKMTRKNESGSTMSAVFIYDDKPTALVGSIGDSPVIIYSPEGLIFTSPDHNVRTNLKERERCIARAGWYRDGYIMSATVRDVGLQMARALGDCEMGDVIERVPEFSFVDLQPGSVVVVASDGVFDPQHVSANQDICQIAKRVLEGATAEDTVRESPGKKYDNVTAIVLRME